MEAGAGEGLTRRRVGLRGRLRRGAMSAEEEGEERLYKREARRTVAPLPRMGAEGMPGGESKETRPGVAGSSLV